MNAAIEQKLAHARAIIFDCDGTLVDSLPMYAVAWQAGFKASGSTMSLQWYETRKGLSEAVLMDDFETDHGVTLERDRVVQVMRRTYLEMLEHHLVEIEAVTRIARVQHGRIPLAVASGGSRQIVERSLEALDLGHLFDAIVTFDDVGIPKPAPDLFLNAAQLMGVKPNECLVFEDSDQGLEAARRAGMSAVNVVELAPSKQGD